mgnify:CR=1 FL=1
MTWGSQTMDFIYDENHQPFAMVYKSSASATPVTYYYILNVQGDVMKLVDRYANAVATYTYDPWGKVLTSSGTMANLNPLRYRGYFYDSDTGLYYLQSRYYDPETGRFINADTFATTDIDGLLSANMFAYCENNPVMGVDPNGEFLCTIIGAAVGSICGAIGAMIAGTDPKAAAINGAVSGAVSGLAADVLLITGGSAGVIAGVMAVAGGAGAFFGDAAESKYTGIKKSKDEWIKDVTRDTVLGALFGYMGGPIKSQFGKIAKKGISSVFRQVFRNEMHNLGDTITEEFLGNAIQGLTDILDRGFRNMISQAFGD